MSTEVHLLKLALPTFRMTNRILNVLKNECFFHLHNEKGGILFEQTSSL